MRSYTLAERYQAARKELAPVPVTALNAWRRAKADAENYRFWRALDDGDPWMSYQFDDRHGGRFDSYVLWNGRAPIGSLDLAETYEERGGAALRIEIEYVADPDGAEWETTPEPLADLVAHYRGQKYGKADSLVFARASHERQATEHRRAESGQYSQMGVVVRVYWRGELMADESLWGIIYYDSDDALYSVRDVVGTALYEARRAIRANARNVRAQVREFGFQPVAGYRPAA